MTIRLPFLIIAVAVLAIVALPVVAEDSDDAETPACENEVLPEIRRITPEVDYQRGGVSVHIWSTKPSGVVVDNLPRDADPDYPWRPVIQIKESGDKWPKRTVRNRWPSYVKNGSKNLTQYPGLRRYWLHRLKAGTDYSVRMYSKCLDGDDWVLSESVTETVKFNTNDEEPGEPRNFRVRQHAKHRDRMILEWDAPESGGAVGRYAAFVIHPDNSLPIEDAIDHQFLGPRKTKAVFKGLETGVRYEVSINAENRTGSSEVLIVYFTLD